MDRSCRLLHGQPRQPYDTNDRQRRRSEQRGDKLAPIRTFYEQWNQNLQLPYVPSANITIDEQLIAFRVRCPFKVYITRKPGKYGMKAWIAADSDTAFCLQFQIYLGKMGDNAERIQGGSGCSRLSVFIPWAKYDYR